jgi:hypothetical protein
MISAVSRATSDEEFSIFCKFHSFRGAYITDRVMVKPNEPYTEEEQKRINAVNRHYMGERPSKICESGLEGMTIPIKAVKRSGFGMNQRATEECS